MVDELALTTNMKRRGAPPLKATHLYQFFPKSKYISI